VAPRQDSRTRLLDAALILVRSRGYAATRVDDICAAAGVTKGSFFHHFKGKDDLALAAVTHWADTTGALFASAPYHAPADPLDRVLAYVTFRKALLAGDLPEFTCYVGTLLQEVYRTHPPLAAACEACLTGHAGTLETDIAAAMTQAGLAPDWTAASLALHIQAVIQGAFILAKATAAGSADPGAGVEVARHSLDHLHRYLTLLLSPGAASASP